jgi:hypothetical protein
MQSAARPTRRGRSRPPGPGSLATANRVVAGSGWLVIAAGFAWLAFATPLLAELVRLDAPTTATPLLGAAAWAVALVAPAGFAILGLARLGGAVAQVRGRRSRRPPVSRMAADLPPGCVVVPTIHLPDGTRIPDVVIGPHGVAIFERLPPLAAVRRTGERWDVRFSDGSWRPIENPLRRAARDAERLRRHLEAEEREFVVRVQAAVLGDPMEVARAEGCAVVPLRDVPAWLAALPAQRALTPDRIAHLRQILEALA